MRAYRRVVATGRQLRLVAPAQVVRRVLSLNGLDPLVSAYPSREAAIAAGPPAAKAATAAALSHLGQDLLDRIARNLLTVGLSLETALDSPHEADRQHIMQALQHLDDTVRRDPRSRLHRWPPGRPCPITNRQAALGDARRPAGERHALDEDQPRPIRMRRARGPAGGRLRCLRLRRQPGRIEVCGLGSDPAALAGWVMARDAVEEGPDRRCGNPVHDHPVKPRAHGARRRAVRPGQRQRGGVVPGGSQRDVGIQDREQFAARPGYFPPQREPGRTIACLQFPEMHLDKPG